MVARRARGRMRAFNSPQGAAPLVQNAILTEDVGVDLLPAAEVADAE